MNFYYICIMNIFKEQILDTFILNIPHSSYIIPDVKGFDIELMEIEKTLLTDHETDKIFNVPGLSSVVCDFNRVFCDVERFINDEDEIMSESGMGVLYTHTDSGVEFRKFTPEDKVNIIAKYYDPYQKRIENLVKKKLSDNGVVRIIDCHSFTNIPFNRDINKSNSRPDICLGIDGYHTPNYLSDSIRIYFEKKGYIVKINDPYSGSFVPMKYYFKNKNVESIMIEINRDLYMVGDKILDDKVIELNELIIGYFNEI